MAAIIVLNLVPGPVLVPVVAQALAASATQGVAVAAMSPGCAGGDGPWTLLQIGPPESGGGNRELRERVLFDLQHTLAVRGIASCSSDVHPATPPLAAVEIALTSGERASVDVEIRDAVTPKRLRRDVDLSLIPEDGRAAAIAIEADELLQASLAELALDTARAREAQARARAQPEAKAEARSAAERGAASALPPRRMDRVPSVGARAVWERYLGGITLYGADGVGFSPVGARLGVELAGALRFGPAERAPHGQVSAFAAGGGAAVIVRIAGDWATSLATGAGVSLAWLRFRGEPAAGAEGASYGDLLATVKLKMLGRVALGRSLHATAGLDGGVTLRGVEATDAGTTVARARGLVIGATLGLETP